MLTRPANRSRRQASRGSRYASICAACVLAAATLITAAGARANSAPSPRRAGSAGVTVVLPRGWHSFPQGVAPQSMPYGDPRVRVVAASTTIVPFPRGCKAETFRFAAGGVGLMIVEWTHPQTGVVWPPRPRRFTDQTLLVRKPPAVECWPGAAGAIQFAANGRHFAAYLLLAPHTPLAEASLARAVLGTLAVSARH
jgi:hypothetical protein